MNKWNLIKIDPNGITIEYQEKYGSLVSIKCIGLWENQQTYRLTYKDSKFIELQKCNIISLEIK